MCIRDRVVGYRRVIAGSALLLGAPAFGYMLGMDAITLLPVSAVRGVGFGALSVAEAAIIAELVPLRLLGRATGLLGLVVGAAQMCALPLGLAMANVVGYNAVYALGATVGLVALVVSIFIPSVTPVEPDRVAPNLSLIHI